MNMRQKYLSRVTLCLVLGFANGLLAAGLFMPDMAWPALFPAIPLSGWLLWKAGVFR